MLASVSGYTYKQVRQDIESIQCHLGSVYLTVGIMPLSGYHMG